MENNKCTKICEIGLEENCKECNKNIEHKEECLSCNEGYFLPENSKKNAKNALLAAQVVLEPLIK